MKKLLAMTVAVASLSTLVMAGGLEVGSNVGAFYVKDVTGPSAGEKLCYRCRYQGAPVVSIFTRDANANVAELIEKVDGVVGENKSKDMKAFVVLLSSEPDTQEGKLKSIADEKKIKNTPLTTFENAAGPDSYKISPEAEVTVMMWVDGKLKVNEAYKPGEFTKEKIQAVVGKTSNILN